MAYRGPSLRALRQEKKITLRSIADETRITSWYLSAIEEERFDRFPGSFYFKSFARAYARSLGLEPSDVLRDLQPAYEEWQRTRTPSEALRSGESILSRLAGKIRKPFEV